MYLVATTFLVVDFLATSYFLCHFVVVNEYIKFKQNNLKTSIRLLTDQLRQQVIIYVLHDNAAPRNFYALQILNNNYATMIYNSVLFYGLPLTIVSRQIPSLLKVWHSHL